MDNIEHPSHYTKGNIEVIDYMKDQLTKEEFQGYLQGNIIKYISRYKHKNGVEDLKKAKWYIDKLIKEIGEIKKYNCSNCNNRYTNLCDKCLGSSNPNCIPTEWSEKA